MNKRDEFLECYQKTAEGDQALYTGFAAYELGTDEGNDAGHLLFETYLRETQAAISTCSEDIKETFASIDAQLRSYKKLYCNLSKEVGQYNYDDN